MALQQALSASLQYISVEIGIPTSKQSQRSYQPTDRAAIRCFVCSSDLAAVYGMRLNRTRSSTTRSGRTPSRSHKPRISTVNTHILAGIELGWLSPPSRGSSTCWLHSHRHLVAGRTLSRRRRAPPLAPPDASHCRLHKGSSVHPVLPLPTESFISTWSTNKEKPSQVADEDCAGTSSRRTVYMEQSCVHVHLNWKPDLIHMCPRKRFELRFLCGESQIDCSVWHRDSFVLFFQRKMVTASRSYPCLFVLGRSSIARGDDWKTGRHRDRLGHGFTGKGRAVAQNNTVISRKNRKKK
jgi:hypothetical protein